MGNFLKISLITAAIVIDAPHLIIAAFVVAAVVGAR